MVRNALLVLALAALALPAGASGLENRDPVDLRSPDAKDARLPAQKPIIVSNDTRTTGFDWGDAGIGAGGAIGLMLIAVSVTFSVIHRRRRREGSGGPPLAT